MIHFLEQHFVELVTITSIIYLTLATILLLYQTPDTAVYKTFRRSKRLMAGGMMLISLNIWIWIASFTGSWTEYNNWVPCFDIILFYLMGICFSFSLSSLLDPHYISRKRCRTIAVKFTMTAFFALIAMTDALKAYQIPLLLIALIGLLEMLIGHIYYFNKCYLRSNALFENYFSNGEEPFHQMAQGEPLALLRHADTGRDIHPYGCPVQLAGAILCGGHEPLYSGKHHQLLRIRDADEGRLR